ncbi:heterokaryon incompatibility protein-domain-containing protein [Pyrenochaeta sp. MPI-SDFR-AT-0127]|nr:heterokaryon incompatibility protein-domain-containing protein [Pyrenochaeta sp. MPI-SDFR-AT-0127]
MPPLPSQLYDSPGLELRADHPQTIRILKLEGPLPASGPDGRRMFQASLRVVDLEDCPSFTALSYTWGSRSAPHVDVIICNGYLIEITANCYDALSSLYTQYGVIDIWVDAICINQAFGNSEKQRQLELMEDIYTFASKVYIWLGRATSRSEKALDCILSAPINQRFFVGVNWVSTPKERRMLTVEGWETFRECFKAMFGKKNSPLRYDNFEDLLGEGREWISRIWTFQEIVLATSPVIVCSNRSISWDSFVRAIRFLDYFYGRRRWQGPNCSRVQEDILAWSHLIRLWMHLERKTRWNKRQIRNSVTYKPIVDILEAVAGRPPPTAERASFFAYQKAARASIVKDIERLLKFGPYVLALTITIISIALSSAARTSRKISIARLVAVIVLALLAVVIIFLAWRFPCKLYILRSEGIKVQTDARNLSLEALLRALRLRNTTCPVDRVRALTGVLKALGIEYEILEDSAPLGLVYRSLFESLLVATQNLNLLLDAGLPGYAGQPSWVPQWDSIAARKWIDAESLYNVRVARLPNLDNVVQGNLLHVRASCDGGSIIYHSPLLREVDNLAYMTDNHLWNFRILDDWINAVKNRRRLWIGEPTLDHLYELLHVEYKYLVETGRSEVFKIWITIMDDMTTSGSRYQSSAYEVALRKLYNVSVGLYHLEICRELSKQRALFVTSTGHSGTCVTGVAENDYVMEVVGVSMPLVLRKVAEGDIPAYSIIGPSSIYRASDDTTLEQGAMHSIALV